MYLEYYGLKEAPFSITPDPRYLFMSERHAEALAHLLYGITEAGGFTVEAVPSRVRLVRPVQNAVSDAPGLTDFPSIELTATEKAAFWSG